jgi:hypothetical protein
MTKNINPAKFRKLSPDELRKIGSSPKSERYIETGKRVTKSTRTISRRAHEQARLGTTLEKAVRQRQRGERPYKTMATKEAARKQRRTRDPFIAEFERRARDRRLTHLHPPTHRGKRRITYEREAHAKPYRLPDARRARLARLRQDKLDTGEDIEDWGDWKAVVDLSRMTKDPHLPRLLKSSGK